MQQHMERLIALNALRYADSMALGANRKESNDSSLTLPTIYPGLVVKPYYQPPEIQELDLKLLLMTKGRKRLRGKTALASSGSTGA